MKSKIGMFAMLIIGLLAGIVIASSTGTVSAEKPASVQVERVDVKLVINGLNSVERPVIIDGQSYLPLRVIATIFDFGVHWDIESRTIDITKNPSDAVVVEE